MEREATGLRCPELIGRDAELAALLEPLDRPWSSTTLIRGVAGVGKSALLAAAERRRYTGVRVVGRCADSAAPLRSLREIALAAVKAGAELDETGSSMFRWGYRALLGGVGEFVPLAPDEAPPQALLVGEALLQLLAMLPSPVIVDIEDLHWADAATLAVIDHIEAALPERGHHVRMTVRSDESQASAHAAGGWPSRRGRQTLDLAPLTSQDVSSMVIACLGADPPESLVRMVEERSDGVPFLVEELLIGATESSRLVRVGATWVDDAAIEPELPPTLADLTRRRFESLEPASQHVILMMALTGRVMDHALLARLGVSAAEMDRAVAAGLETHLLADTGDAEGLRFQHALTRDAMLASADHNTVRDSAVRALGACDPDLGRDRPEIVARLAEAAGDLERCVDLLLAAADQALRMGATSTALDQLDAAARLATRFEDQHRIAIGRVEALALMGRAEAALEEADRVDVRTPLEHDDALRQRLRLARARALGALGRWADAETELEPEYDDDPPSVGVMRALCAIEQGDIDAAASAASAAAERARALADHASTCEAMLIEGRIARGVDLAASARILAAAVTTAERHELPLWRARGLFELGLSEVLIDGREDALHRSREAALDVGALRMSAMADYCVSFNAGWRFEPDRCRFIATRGLETCRHLAIPFLEARLQAQLGKAEALALRRDAAAAAGDRAMALAPDDPEVAGLAFGLCRGYASLLVEDRPAALEEYRTAIGHLRQLPFKTGIQPWRLWPLLMMLDDPEGEGATARAEVDVPELRVQNGLATMFRLADAVAAARAGDPGAAMTLVRDVRSFYDPLPEPWHGTLHLGMRLTAEAALRDGWGDPVTWLADAEAWFAPRGYKRISQACRALLRDAGVEPRTRGPGRTEIAEPLRERGITTREAEVLELVAEGLTNNMIAERLRVSPWTVKSQVSSLLRKVGAANRSQLAAFALSVSD